MELGNKSRYRDMYIYTVAVEQFEALFCCSNFYLEIIWDGKSDSWFEVKLLLFIAYNYRARGSNFIYKCINNPYVWTQ